MAEEWAGVIHSTAPKYLKGAADLTIRQRLLLRLLQRRGRITFNHNSHKLIWDVEMAEIPVEAYADGGLISFQRHDLLRQLEIDWRGYKATDMMTRKEKLMNAGDVAIVRRYERIMPSLTKAMRNKFASELYLDGYAAGNENRLHGLESFMGAGACAAGDIIALPSDTYGGKATNLQTEGGTWTATGSSFPNATIATDWPNGNGTPEYDYLAPKLLNWSSTGWGTGGTTWEDNCERVIRRGISWCTLTGGEDGKPQIVMLEGNMFFGFQNYMSSRQRVLVEHKEANDLGFPGTLNFDGTMIHQEFNCPTNTGYGLNLSEMELASLAAELFFSVGPTYDPKTDSWLFMTGFYGNGKYQPKHFFKTYNYA